MKNYTFHQNLLFDGAEACVIQTRQLVLLEYNVEM